MGGKTTWPSKLRISRLAGLFFSFRRGVTIDQSLFLERSCVATGCAEGDLRPAFDVNSVIWSTPTCSGTRSSSFAGACCLPYVMFWHLSPPSPPRITFWLSHAQETNFHNNHKNFSVNIIKAYYINLWIHSKSAIVDEWIIVFSTVITRNFFKS